MALPVAAGAGVGAEGDASFLAAFGVAAGAGAIVPAGAAVASAPHSALRKSFHLMPLAVPAACAALYLALHSCMVRACAGLTIVAKAVVASSNPEKTVIARIVMGHSP